MCWQRSLPAQPCDVIEQVHGHDLSCLACLPAEPQQESRVLYASGSEEKVLRVLEAPQAFLDTLALAQGRAASQYTPSQANSEVSSRQVVECVPVWHHAGWCGEVQHIQALTRCHTGKLLVAKTAQSCPMFLMDTMQLGIQLSCAYESMRCVPFAGRGPCLGCISCSAGPVQQGDLRQHGCQPASCRQWDSGG